jgi:hypothetical protein
VPLFSCRFWKPHRAGEVLPKFSIDTIIFFLFAGEAIALSAAALAKVYLYLSCWSRGCLPRHRQLVFPRGQSTCCELPFSLLDLQFSYLFMFVDHVTQLGVSRSKEIRLKICRSLHIYNRICFELSTFLTARGCVDKVSFHGLIRSKTEFRHHLPFVLQIHISLPGRVFWEQQGGAVKILSRIGVEHEN